MYMVHILFEIQFTTNSNYESGLIDEAIENDYFHYEQVYRIVVSWTKLKM